MTPDLRDALDELTADFAGIVSVSRAGVVVYERAYGLADRALGVPLATDTPLAIASATKGFTALAVVTLVLDGALTLDTTARSVLGTDLPLIGDDVSVEHLLTHRSGIGDYVDEDGPELPLKVPVQALDATENYLPALDGFAPKFAAGARFSYCNSGYVVLALLAERVAGTAFADLVRERVFVPAGMSDTCFPRSDRLPARAAAGYLADGRTNVFSLPVVGSGDGGAYSTVRDIRLFWSSLFDGRIVPLDWARRMTQPVVADTGHRMRYGLGFWLGEDGPQVMLEGCDHGVSFRSVHQPDTCLTATVIANTADGAWPIARKLRGLLF